MAWDSVQVCDECWHREEPTRVPHKMVEEFREETVCLGFDSVNQTITGRCAKLTKSGIYVRLQGFH